MIHKPFTERTQGEEHEIVHYAVKHPRTLLGITTNNFITLTVSTKGMLMKASGTLWPLKIAGKLTICARKELLGVDFL